FALVLAPILLVYMIFYGILDRLNLFDDPRIQRGIPIILALMLAPLGGYRHFFYGVTSFMTFGTASLLYIFLFVALLGYGYKNMYARGRSDFSKSSQMMQHAKNKSGQIKDVESRLKKLYRELADVDSQLHKYQFEMTELKTGNKKVPEGLIKTIKHIEKKHEHINNQISRLNNYQDELSKNMEIIIHGD
ncbi:MAG: hypothetical protein U9P44_03580, partial [archaeon]|nr:hypothetical protein [archaeon]